MTHRIRLGFEQSKRMCLQQVALNRYLFQIKSTIYIYIYNLPQTIIHIILFSCVHLCMHICTRFEFASTCYSETCADSAQLHNGVAFAFGHGECYIYIHMYIHLCVLMHVQVKGRGSSVQLIYRCIAKANRCK